MTASCDRQPTIHAEQIAVDKSWGNTEGPAIDSRNNLYFCSCGTFKGIVQWNDKDGASQWLAVATKEGPGGLWIDDADNIYLTATGERQILKVTPDKNISVVAEKFEANPKVPRDRTTSSFPRTAISRITTEQKALTNCKFGRGSQSNLLYLTSSDMERVTGYIYRANVEAPGIR